MEIFDTCSTFSPHWRNFNAVNIVSASHRKFEKTEKLRMAFGHQLSKSRSYDASMLTVFKFSSLLKLHFDQPGFSIFMPLDDMFALGQTFHTNITDMNENLFVVCLYET